MRQQVWQKLVAKRAPQLNHDVQNIRDHDLIPVYQELLSNQPDGFNIEDKEATVHEFRFTGQKSADFKKSFDEAMKIEETRIMKELTPEAGKVCHQYNPRRP